MGDELRAKDLWEYDQEMNVSMLDIFSTLAAALIILFVAMLYRNRKEAKDPAYKYFTIGLLAKIIGSIFFCCIYVFYYDKKGDTIAYFESSMAMANLFYDDTSKYLEVLFSNPSAEVRSLFSDKTGYPYGYLFYDPKTFNVVKLTSFLTILTSKSYFLSSLLLACISYFGSWKLFKVFRQYAPEIEDKLAFAILYFPSPLFWGGGISKDTFIFMATTLVVYCAHEFFIMKKMNTSNVILLGISLWLILGIKPYIFLILFPGGLLWLFYNRLTRIRNKFAAFILFPLILISILGISYVVLSGLGGSMAKYSLDKAFETAAVTSKDLKQDYYHGSSFDIGDFDGSLGSVVTLTIPAINAGLFRPFIWESRSVVLLMAGLENGFLLFFTIYLLYKTKVKGTVKIIGDNPLLLFCMVFSVFFAFMIGISTSNFGALVRFKIPLLPFFVSALFIIDYLRKTKKYNFL